MTREDKRILAIVGGVTAFAAGAFTLTYLVTGRREQNSPFIPDAIEDKIDTFVAWLDRKFTKQWVSKEMDVVQRAIAAEMPLFASLLNVVVAAEQAGKQFGLRGGAKRQFAIQQLKTN